MGAGSPRRRFALRSLASTRGSRASARAEIGRAPPDARILLLHGRARDQRPSARSRCSARNVGSTTPVLGGGGAVVWRARQERGAPRRRAPAWREPAANRGAAAAAPDGAGEQRAARPASRSSTHLLDDKPLAAPIENLLNVPCSTWALQVQSHLSARCSRCLVRIYFVSRMPILTACCQPI